MRFWSILVCALLAAWVLGRISLSPLRSVEWMLLALGLTQVPLPAALAVIGWLFFLGLARPRVIPSPSLVELQFASDCADYPYGGRARSFRGRCRRGSSRQPGDVHPGQWFQPHFAPLVSGQFGCHSPSARLHLGLHLVVSFPHARVGALARRIVDSLASVGMAAVRAGGCFRRIGRKALTPPPVPTQS